MDNLEYYIEESTFVYFYIYKVLYMIQTVHNQYHR